MVSLREMARADAERFPPAWLQPLLSAIFFEPCPEHPEASRATRSGGCNRFCIDCIERPLCHVCVAGDHVGHHVLQVRRSSKHNTVKVKDVKAMLDVDEVQTYLINGESVVFLNPRPQAGNGKGGDIRCVNCARALLKKAYRFCSLGCKLECMEWDFDIWFSVRHESESGESSEEEDEEESDDDDAAASPLPTTKRLRTPASRSGKGADEEDGAATAPTASPPTTPSPPLSS